LKIENHLSAARRNQTYGGEPVRGPLERSTSNVQLSTSNQLTTDN
jgi:hypothetical protein